ncbi:F-actin-capping protein subunit beta, partial [Claviceps sp. LM77 group G4]
WSRRKCASSPHPSSSSRCRIPPNRLHIITAIRSNPPRLLASQRQLPPPWLTIPLTRRCTYNPKSHASHSPTPQTDLNPLDSLPPTSDLLRRLNPKHTADHLNAIISLAPDLTEDLLSSVDQPLTIRRCKQTGREYLLCDYNRDGDSYRSPWSNQFDPPLDEAGVGGVGAGGSEGAGEGAIPSERVRKMEMKANDAFDVYRDLYYEGGVSSVYFWNLDDGFAGVVLLKKSSTPGSSTQGVWDSIHVFEAIERGRTTHYKLTSTVILSLATADNGLGDMDLSGNMTRQVEQDMPVDNDDSHIANVGRLVEDMELKMRNLLQEVYFGKAKDVVGDLRSVGSLSDGARDREAQRELIGSMRK